MLFREYLIDNCQFHQNEFLCSLAVICQSILTFH
jgi:hypothetical protein